jgi:hypothetical protein
VVAGVGVMGLGCLALLDVEDLVGRIMGKGESTSTAEPGQGSLSRPSAREWERSLLAIDLGQEGLRQLDLANSRAHADLDRDGFAERRAWFAPEEGLLARDRNDNGMVDSAAELLIGERGSTAAAIALMALDSDQDGRITASDPEFRRLLVWRDLDGDGRATEAEVRALSSYFVAAVEPIPTVPPPGSEDRDVRQIGQVRYSDGRKVSIFEAGLSSDPGDTEQLVPAGFQIAPAVLQMPVLDGGGRIGNSAVAMSRDASLREKGHRLVGVLLAGDLVTYRREIEGYLHRWAGLPDTLAPGSPESAVSFVAASWGLSPAELWKLLPSGSQEETAASVAEAYRTMRDAHALSFARQAVELQNGAAARGLSSSHPLSFLVASAPVSRRPGSEQIMAAELQSIAASMIDSVLSGRLSMESGIAGMSMVFSGDARTVGFDGGTVLLDAATTVLKKETPSEMIARFEADRAEISAAAEAMDAGAAGLVPSVGGRGGIWGLVR